VTPNEIFFGLIALAIIALVVFLIWFILKLVDTIGAVKKVLVSFDGALQTTLGELNENLRSLRNVTDNMTAVTNDAKVLSGSVKDVGESVRQIGNSVRRIADLVQEIRSETTGTISGVRAGFKAGFDTFLKSLFSERDSR
jgi:uncharacterized protein YoxC